jgi:hypothetical protein
MPRGAVRRGSREMNELRVTLSIDGALRAADEGARITAARLLAGARPA